MQHSAALQVANEQGVASGLFAVLVLSAEQSKVR
jgi:hypothetical protein